MENALGFPYLQNEFKQALSQVNLYMKQHGTHYGFVVTDQEFMAIRQVDQNGNLELSQAIPWTASGTVSQSQLTVSLVTWYLGMLACYDNGWRA